MDLYHILFANIIAILISPNGSFCQDSVVDLHSKQDSLINIPPNYLVMASDLHVQVVQI